MYVFAYVYAERNDPIVSACKYLEQNVPIIVFA